jgi:hypothetical protein
MKELLARHAQLNAALDLDKNETQIAPPERTTSGLWVTLSSIAWAVPRAENRKHAVSDATHSLPTRLVP